MANGVAIHIGRKSRKRGLTTRQRASSLYRLWHTIQDIKEDAEQMKDSELVLLVGMVELLVEERTAGLTPRGALLAAADTSRPH